MSIQLLPQSAEHIYRDHHGWLLGWVRHRINCKSDAEDLTQDTFTRILAKAEPVNINEPRAYLATIARGLLINHYKRKDIEKACMDALASLPETVSASPEVRHEYLQILIQLNELLDGLPRKVKNAFLLSQLDGLTYKEIAAKMDVSVASVKKYMYKATCHCVNYMVSIS